MSLTILSSRNNFELNQTVTLSVKGFMSLHLLFSPFHGPNLELTTLLAINEC